MKLIDLHLHLDGSVPFNTMKKLLLEHDLPVPDDAALRRKLSVGPDCHNLNEFLEKFPFVTKLMQSQRDLKLIVFDLLKELKKQGLVYVEIRFAPQLHTEHGLSQQEVVAAARAGIDQFLFWQKKQNSDRPDLHANLLLCMMRLPFDNEKENLETIKTAKHFLGHKVVGVDLAGAETEQLAVRNYADLFKQAKKWGIPYTIHAGEAMGPDSIRQALALDTKRIGHGISCVKDPELVQELIQKKVTLECCATSNLNTKAFDQIDHYPVKKLLHQGVKVTLNTDDMTVSNINLPHEYHLLEDKTNLNRDDEKQLYLNAVNAAFCSPVEKERLLSLL